MNFTNRDKLANITNMVDEITNLRDNSTGNSTTVEELTNVRNMVDKIAYLRNNSTRMNGAWVNRTTVEELRNVTYITNMEFTCNS